jgi:amidohydrolase
MIGGLKKDVKELRGKIIEWRRDFHRHPEIAYQEKRTSSVIRQFLEELDIPVSTCAETGLRGILKGLPGVHLGESRGCPCLWP